MRRLRQMRCFEPLQDPRMRCQWKYVLSFLPFVSFQIAWLKQTSNVLLTLAALVTSATTDVVLPSRFHVMMAILVLSVLAPRLPAAHTPPPIALAAAPKPRTLALTTSVTPPPRLAKRLRNVLLEPLFPTVTAASASLVSAMLMVCYISCLRVRSHILGTACVQEDTCAPSADACKKTTCSAGKCLETDNFPREPTACETAQVVNGQCTIRAISCPAGDACNVFSCDINTGQCVNNMVFGFFLFSFSHDEENL